MLHLPKLGGLAVSVLEPCHNNKKPALRELVGMSLRLMGICGLVSALAVLWAAPSLAAGASATAGATNQQEQFETRLAPSPMTDGQHAGNPGEGRARATLDGNKLTVSA